MLRWNLHSLIHTCLYTLICIYIYIYICVCVFKDGFSWTRIQYHKSSHMHLVRDQIKCTHYSSTMKNYLSLWTKMNLVCFIITQAHCNHTLSHQDKSRTIASRYISGAQYTQMECFRKHIWSETAFPKPLKMNSNDEIHASSSLKCNERPILVETF